MSGPRPVVAVDFDGTLLSLPVEWTRVRTELGQLWRAWGVDVPVDVVYVRLEQALALLAGRGLDGAQIIARRRDVHAIMERAELDAVARATVLPGARNFIAWLASAGLSWGVVTNNGATVARQSLVRHGFALPPVVVGREDVSRPKPAPDGLVRLLDHYGRRPNEGIIVGDGDFEIAAAGVVGSRSIHLRRPGARGLRYTRPWRTARTFGDVRRLIEAVVEGRAE